MGVRTEIVQQRLVRNGNAVREAGRTAGILQIGDVAAVRLGQGNVGSVLAGKGVPAISRNRAGLAGSTRQFCNLVRKQQYRRVTAVELHTDLVDIAFLAAKRGRQRQLRFGIGDQRHPVARLDICCDQALRRHQRIFTQFTERIGADKRTAGIMKIETFLSLGRIIQSVTQCIKIGEAPR